MSIDHLYNWFRYSPSKITEWWDRVRCDGIYVSIHFSKHDHKQSLNASKYASTIYEIDMKCRGWLKYSENISEDEAKRLEEIRDMAREEGTEWMDEF